MHVRTDFNVTLTFHPIGEGGEEKKKKKDTRRFISLKAKAKVDLEQSISFKYLHMYWTAEICTHSF